MISSIQWPWIWTSPRRWWRIGKPGVLQSMGWQRVGHNWVTEQQHVIYYRSFFPLNQNVPQSEFHMYIYIHTHIYDKCSVVICWLVFVVAVMFFLLWWEIWLRKHIVWIHRKKCNQNKQEHLRNSGSYLDSNIGVIFKRKIFKLKIISVLVKPLGSISWVHCCLQKHCSKHIYQKYDKIV